MGTATGLRISAVDGTAFLDNCPADIIAAVDKKVKIYDSSSRYLEGWVKAAGSSEGLGSEQITGWTNHASYPFETFTTSGTNITQAINTDVGVAYQSIDGNLGMLYKYVCDATLTSGISPLIGMSPNNASLDQPRFVQLTTASFSVYKSGIGNNDYFTIWISGSCEFVLINNSLKQVTAPSSSGVTITSTSGGSTYNWTSKDASFTYNAASYTYEIISGNPRSKRFGGVPYAALNRGVF